MVIVKTGVLQCGDKPRLNVVAAAWAQHWFLILYEWAMTWAFEVVLTVFPCPRAPLFLGVADLHSTSGMCLLDFPCCTRGTFPVQITVSWCLVSLAPLSPGVLHLFAIFQEFCSLCLCHPIPGTHRTVWIPLQFLLDNPSLPLLYCFWRNAWFQKGLLTGGKYVHNLVVVFYWFYCACAG